MEKELVGFVIRWRLATPAKGLGQIEEGYYLGWDGGCARWGVKAAALVFPTLKAAKDEAREVWGAYLTDQASYGPVFFRRTRLVRTPTPSEISPWTYKALPVCDHKTTTRRAPPMAFVVRKRRPIFYLDKADAFSQARSYDGGLDAWKVVRAREIPRGAPVCPGDKYIPEIDG